jgi:hypothetical protein
MYTMWLSIKVHKIIVYNTYLFYLTLAFSKLKAFEN